MHEAVTLNLSLIYRLVVTWQIFDWVLRISGNAKSAIPIVPVFAGECGCGGSLTSQTRWRDSAEGSGVSPIHSGVSPIHSLTCTRQQDFCVANEMARSLSHAQYAFKRPCNQKRNELVFLVSINFLMLVCLPASIESDVRIIAVLCNASGRGL